MKKEETKNRTVWVTTGQCMGGEVEGYWMDIEKHKYKEHYKEFWDEVKQSIDEEGWVYTKEVKYLLDAIYENNTGIEIEFQKSFGKSGNNPNWETRGSRWRPVTIK